MRITKAVLIPIILAVGAAAPALASAWASAAPAATVQAAESTPQPGMHYHA